MRLCRNTSKIFPCLSSNKFHKIVFIKRYLNSAASQNLAVQFKPTTQYPVCSAEHYFGLANLWVSEL